MCVSGLRICLVLVLSISLSSSEVTIENGGYNLLVAFSQNVPSDSGMELINEMETSLREASQVLHHAIGLQFSKVTFEIPESWDTSQYNKTVKYHFNSESVKADILIDKADDTTFGKFPFAHQYGSCGVKGHQVIVPTAFFSESNEFPKGVSLAREWLKYRYGVFDENGYLGDPLYPLYYKTPGSDNNDIQINSCTNNEITYNITNLNGEECPSDKMLIDKLNAKECELHLNAEDVQNVTSSLMYFQETITGMTHICGKDDDHKHNSRSPNKQNILCTGKSIWDVVSQSNDFKNKLKEDHTEVEFVLTKLAERRVVVAWENTKNLYNKGNIVLNAIKKLLIDLPDGSKFIAFPFPPKGNVAEDYTLKDLNLVQRKAISTDIKGAFTREDGNYTEAIDKAISILKAADENSEEPSGDIIIITGTPAELVVILLKNIKTCIKSFDGNSFPQDINNLTPSLPCLEVVRISTSEESNKVYEKLIETIEAVCPSKVQDKFTEMVKIDFLNETNSLKFVVDNYTETVTFSIFTSEEEGDSFKLEFDGEIQKLENEETYTNVFKISYSPPRSGEITFSYANSISKTTLVEVKKTSKPGQYFSGQIIVHDTTGEEENQMPVIIYAVVRFGSYPVENALVFAEIQEPDGDTMYLEDFNDDGKGDPDITHNDGIYSRYFTNFTKAGEYTVILFVADGDFTARKGINKTAGYKSCCGSIVMTDGSQEPLRIRFTQVFEATFNAKSGRPDDGYKPSKIMDLRIDAVNDDGIILKWTAPGGEADSGAASRYAIKAFCGGDRTECNIVEVIQVLNEPHPLNYGQGQSLKINIIDKTQTVSICIIAINKNNKTSDFSNIIEIFRNPGGIVPEIIPEPVKTNLKTGTVVGWVIAGVLIIICIIGVVVYLRKRQQHKNPELRYTEEKDDNKIKSATVTIDNPIKTETVKRVESFPVLLYTHDQIKDYKNKENDQPLYKSTAPPKQWKSLDAISNMQNGGGRGAKSIGSSSTLNLEENNNKKGAVNNGE